MLIKNPPYDNNMNQGRDFLKYTLQKLAKEAKQLLQEYGSCVAESDDEDSDAMSMLKKDDGNGLVSIRSAKLNLKPIRLVKRLFTTQWHASTSAAGLPINIFIDRISPILLPNATPAQVQMATTRIDTDANGIIDWEELSAYLLINQYAADDNIESNDRFYQFAPKTTKSKDKKTPHPVHKDCIHKLVTTPDRYYTASIDGTVKVWNNSTQRFMSTLHNDSSVAKSRFISDLSYFHVSDRLAVFQIDRTITLYDNNGIIHKMYRGGSSNERFREITEAVTTVSQDGRRERVTTVTKKVEVISMEGLTYSPMCAEAATSSMHKRIFPQMTEPVFIGLEQGWIQLYNFKKDTGRESDSSLRVQQQWRPHSSWVTYIRQCDRLDSLITLSMDKWLHVYNLEKGEITQSLGGPHANLSTFSQKDAGILGIDYNEDLNLIATWGASNVHLWNPTMANPTKLIQKSPVVSVRFNPEERHAIVLTEDKLINIYDIRSARCLQQIVDKTHRYPDNKFSALEYDVHQSAIIACSNLPVVFSSQQASFRGPNPSATREGHTLPVLSSLYNTHYDHVITTDIKRVYIWDAKTGGKITSWSPGGRLMCAALDAGQRRLITGLSGGELVIWNYINGEQLKRCNNPNTFELTCIQHVEGSVSASAEGGAFVVAAGWSSQILLWSDVAGEFFTNLRQEINIGNHWGHIYSISYSQPNRLALGTTSGAVLVYDIAQVALLTILKADLPRPVSSFGNDESESSESEFSIFRKRMQQGLSSIVEQVVILSNSLILSLHGSSLVVLWRTALRESNEVVAAFTAAHSKSEEAFSMTTSSLAKGECYVGDSQGIVSVFNISEILDIAHGRPTATPLNSAPARRDNKASAEALRAALTVGRSSLVSGSTIVPSKRSSQTVVSIEEGFQVACSGPRVSLVACFRPHTAVVSSIVWLSRSNIIITSSADTNIVFSTTRGVILAKLGSNIGWPLKKHSEPEEEELCEEQSQSEPADTDSEQTSVHNHQWTQRVKEHVSSIDEASSVRIKNMMPDLKTPIAKRFLQPSNTKISRSGSGFGSPSEEGFASPPSATDEITLDTRLPHPPSADKKRATLHTSAMQVSTLVGSTPVPKQPKPPPPLDMASLRREELCSSGSPAYSVGSPASVRTRPQTARTKSADRIEEALHELKCKPRKEVIEITVTQERPITTGMYSFSITL